MSKPNVQFYFEVNNLSSWVRNIFYKYEIFIYKRIFRRFITYIFFNKFILHIFCGIFKI